MGQYFSLSELIPVLSRLISESYAKNKEWVTRDELKEALEADREGNRLVESAWKKYQEKKPPAGLEFTTSKDWLVGNMIDWFSADYTKHQKSALASKFDRIEIQGYPAYKPKGPKTV